MPRLSASRLPKKSAGQILAGPLSDFWAGGQGPSHDAINRVLDDHGVDRTGMEGINKTKKVYEIMRSVEDDDVALSILDGLLVGIRSYSTWPLMGSQRAQFDAQKKNLQRAVEEVGLELTDDLVLAFPESAAEEGYGAMSGVRASAPAAPLPASVFSELRSENVKAAAPSQSTDIRGPKSIFLVHGHDRLTLLEVERFVRRITGIEPTILNDEANAGQTLIEKFEGASAPAAFAIVMMTPDDLGKAKTVAPDIRDGADNSLALRARQNVVFELGYFYGVLGRKNVAVINAGIEHPGDIQGVVYIPWDNEWQAKLARELKRADFTINF
ncbi:TIR domain-containing protein [Pseudarthrobacter sp. NPDC058119]|uniref:TIR domain-containing protein n=1 Tax=Pseudarthrobacter sp. NPDC058119 TaxID=3346348 RepID=UPI0036DAD841